MKHINLTLFAILVFSLALRLGVLFLSHIEGDEVIYQTLAEKLSKNPLDYTLQGTYTINQLPETHNKPLYIFHPPLFCLLLAFINVILGARPEVLIPIISALLTTFLVFLIANELYDKKVALWAAAINTVCPIFLQASTKIWIDATATFFITASVYMALISIKKKKLIYYIFLGGFIGLSLWTKFTAAIILPVIILILLYKNMTRKNIIYTLCALGAAFLLISPWFYWIYSVFGSINFDWLKVNQEFLEIFPFAKLVKNRPFYFYFTNFIMVAPIYLFSFVSLVTGLKKGIKLIESFWVICFIGVFTFSGYAMNFGYIMRYVLPATPAMAILAASFITEKNKPIVYIISIIFLGYGLLTGIVNSYVFLLADTFPLHYFLRPPI
ncbi:MAG: glycosyltransferase family 39 protein [Candidatus Omnitrophota bacterium]|nr:glycosyltransferase family 39 protein [Candidatus Omnitrophota bacterium]